MSNAERDVSRFLAEMHARLDALDQERESVADRDASQSPSASAPSNRTGSANTPRKYANWSSAPPRYRPQFEQRAQETIGDLSQKARAKVAKTKREFQEAVEAIAPAPCASRRAEAHSWKLEKARACG